MNQPTEERKSWARHFKDWPSVEEVQAEKERKARTTTAQFTGGALDGLELLIKDVDPKLITGYRYRQGKPGGTIGELAEPSPLDHLPNIQGYAGPFIQGASLVRYESLDLHQKPTQEALEDVESLLDERK